MIARIWPTRAAPPSQVIELQRTSLGLADGQSLLDFNDSFVKATPSSVAVALVGAEMLLLLSEHARHVLVQRHAHAHGRASELEWAAAAASGIGSEQATHFLL